jgi:hypothetical protein
VIHAEWLWASNIQHLARRYTYYLGINIFINITLTLEQGDPRYALGSTSDSSRKEVPLAAI